VIDFDEFDKYKFSPSSPRVPVACQIVTCNRCGTTELHWKEFGGVYKLVGPGNVVHICKVGPKGKVLA